MSETKADTCICAASGCPMLGTNSRSTTGGADWYCFLHFGAQSQQWHHVTNELNHYQWMVDIIRGLRAVRVARNWPALEVSARQAIMLAQRGDLQMKDHESTDAWCVRLETELARWCTEPAEQEELIPEATP